MKLLDLLPLIILGVATSLCGCTESQTIAKVIPSEALNLIQENQGNPDFIIVDAQPIEEYERRHIDGAINIPIDTEAFRNELNKLDKNKTYLIYGQ
jgi:rhodanese-related sulfurtransferase